MTEERGRSWWQRLPPQGRVLAIVGVVVAFILGWWLLPPLLYAAVASQDVRIKAITDTRTALLAGLIGFGALGTFWLNSRIYKITARTFEVTERGHVTDRYSKAIEQLGSDSLDVRLGGIYALEQIVKDSARGEEDQATIVEVLSAFVRVHSDPIYQYRAAQSAGWFASVRNDQQAAELGASAADYVENRKPPVDVQAAVTVLGRLRHLEMLPRADLMDATLRRVTLHTNLSGAALVRADLTGADLTEANLRQANLRHAILSKADLTGTNLTVANLSRADLAGADLHGAKLRGADLSETDLTGADLTGADLHDANLTSADLHDATLIRADLTGARLGRVKLGGAKLSGVKLTKADLTGKNLSGVDLTGADLGEADLTGTDLTEAKLTGTDLTGAKLTGTDLTGADLTEVNLSGVDLSAADLTRKNLTGADLTGADLTGAKLRGANLGEADLTGADLVYADLTGADLTRAKLGGANLTGADLTGADLVYADLTRADLTRADLGEADLTGADLTGAKLRGANLGGADLTGAKLREADLTGADLTGEKLREGKRELKFDEKKLDEMERFHVKSTLSAGFMHPEPFPPPRVGANLSGADLTGADLSRADLAVPFNARTAEPPREISVRDLTQAQLDQALGDHETRLPADLHRPTTWGAPVAGEDAEHDG